MSIKNVMTVNDLAELTFVELTKMFVDKDGRLSMTELDSLIRLGNRCHMLAEMADKFKEFDRLKEETDELIENEEL